MKPLRFTVKSGEEILVRQATVEDAAALLSMKLDYLKNTSTIPLFLDEYSKDVSKEIELIQRLSEEKNSCLFVAECENQLIGNIDLNGNQRRKLFHTGVIGMGLKKEWRGKGVGSALLKSVIDWSKENKHLTIVWLEVYDSNTAGKKLYEKQGFKECGRMHHFFREDGKEIDKITMVRYLEK